jgi:hypothetical protein
MALQIASATPPNFIIGIAPVTEMGEASAPSEDRILAGQQRENTCGAQAREIENLAS